MSSPRPEDLGKLLVISWNEPRWTRAAERWLNTLRPGGVLLTSRALRSPESTAELLRRISLALDSPPFLALEEEGGTVDPLRAFFPALSSPQALAAHGISAVARLGDLIGRALALLGFNTNLAPVLDLASPLSEPLLGTRTFGADPAQVAECGKAFVRALRQHRILACGKHFPGLSGAQSAGPEPSPVVGKPMAALWREDLVPYRELLPQLPLVMVSHAAYKAYDFDVRRAAMFSAGIVEGLLRVKLDYQGIAVASSLAIEEQRSSHQLDEACLQAIRAGCDLLLAPPGEKSPEIVLAALQKGFESGKIPPRRVEQALARLRTAKRNLGKPGGKISRRTLEALAREIESFRNEFKNPEKKIA